LTCGNNSPEVLNILITYEEIDKTISSMYNMKSPGPAGFVVELFKNSSEIITLKLYLSFNNIINSGIFSRECGKVLICTLQKGQKINMFTEKSRQVLEKDTAQLIKCYFYLL